MGTNPLCFGIPSDEAFPFVIDCATSILPAGQDREVCQIGHVDSKGHGD